MQCSPPLHSTQAMIVRFYYLDTAGGFSQFSVVSGKEWIDWISYYFVPVLMWMWMMMMMVMTAVLGWMEQNKIQQWTESNCVGGECRG